MHACFLLPGPEHWRTILFSSEGKRDPRRGQSACSKQITSSRGRIFQGLNLWTMNWLMFCIHQCLLLIFMTFLSLSYTWFKCSSLVLKPSTAMVYLLSQLRIIFSENFLSWRTFLCMCSINLHFCHSADQSTYKTMKSSQADSRYVLSYNCMLLGLLDLLVAAC